MEQVQTVPMDTSELNSAEQNDSSPPSYLTTRNQILRNYQIKLIEIARKENSIIYLPTGSGKTLIAIHVLCSRGNDLTMPDIKSGRKAFFVTSTKILVFQLAKVILSQTNFKVGFYTGDMNVDSWSKEIWVKELQSHHVLVLTAEILRRLIAFKFLDPKQISLIVFDECHHAVLNHPYKMIMNGLLHLADSEMPLILGLSACLLNSTPKNSVADKLKELELIYRAKIITAPEISEVIRFAADPKEEIIFYNTVELINVDYVKDMYKSVINIFSEHFMSVPESKITTLEEALNQACSNRLGEIKKYLVNAQTLLTEMGIYGGSLAALYYIIQFEKMRIVSDNELEIQGLVFARTELNKIRRVLAKIMHNAETSDIVYQFSSDKVKKLIDILRDKKQLAEINNLSMVVFVHRKATAILLSYIVKRLSTLDKSLTPIKADFIVSSSTFSDTFYDFQCSNAEIVQRFSTKELNVLFATNILEEGVDVSACNSVISFDFPNGVHSYIQSRGRARSKDSSYYIFCPGDSSKSMENLNQYRKIKNNIHEVVMQDSEENDTSGQEEVEEMIYLTEDGQSIKIDGSLAVQCIYRYCSQLPQDRFASLAPLIWYERQGGARTACMQLPINSVIQATMQGGHCSNMKAAKNSVFLKAVKLLHSMNEIKFHLNAKPLELKRKKFNHLFPHYKDEKIDNSSSQPGTNKRKQMYYSKFPQCLSKCLPLPEQKTYLHVINLTVAFDKPTVDRKIALYDLLLSPTAYGILTSKKQERICNFPLFMTMGQIDCEFMVNYDELVFSSLELCDIKLFHFTLFQKVLGILKEYQAYDNRNEENSFFVVPLQKINGTFTINWDVIRSDFCKIEASAVVRYNPSSENARKIANNNYDSDSELEADESDCKALVPSGVLEGKLLWAQTQNEDKRKPKFVLTEATYTNFVITPNYRSSCFQQYYVVSSFCHNMSPLSPFPREEYLDFHAYYKDKYNIHIVNLEQPLLKVSILPNCVNYNGGTNRRGTGRRTRVKEFIELLVPELCNVYPFVKTYWMKAVLVPTVLNRISHIYLVEELRSKIARQTGLGPVNRPRDLPLKPLTVDVAWQKSQEENNSTELSEALNLKLENDLALSNMKKNMNKLRNNTIRPERNLYEIGLCDLENFIEMHRNLDPKAEEKEIKKLSNADDNQNTLRLYAQCSQIPELRVLSASSEHGPELSSLVQAVTSKSANDIFDYERLETLGDSFLKFSTTLFLFRRYEDENEGVLTTIKGKMVGNRNLMYCGVAKNLTDYINVNDFSPKSDWNPPLFCVNEELKSHILARNIDSSVLNKFRIPPKEQLSGKLSGDTLKEAREVLNGDTSTADMESALVLGREVIGDKIISDVVEALVGTYVSEFGLSGGFKILNWLDVLPQSTGSYGELIAKPFEPRLLNSGTEADCKLILSDVFVSKLENTLEYTFKHKALLLEALTHPSYLRNRVTYCYQRLEFLGDAILDFLITTYLYETCGNLGPGEITDIRSSLVDNIAFGCLTVRYELHKYMLSVSADLAKSIDNFVGLQRKRNHVIDESILIHLEEKDCLMAETVTVPKALGDIFESLAGAIFLDSGNSLETVWRVYYKLMEKDIDKFIKKTPKTSVRLLHEYCSEKPYYQTIVSETSVIVKCSVSYKDYDIVTHGFGDNKEKAKMSASKLALKKILEIA